MTINQTGFKSSENLLGNEQSLPNPYNLKSSSFGWMNIDSYTHSQQIIVAHRGNSACHTCNTKIDIKNRDIDITFCNSNHLHHTKCVINTSASKKQNDSNAVQDTLENLTSYQSAESEDASVPARHAHFRRNPNIKCSVCEEPMPLIKATWYGNTIFCKFSIEELNDIHPVYGQPFSIG